jgi:hypothetical protein
MEAAQVKTNVNPTHVMRDPNRGSRNGTLKESMTSACNK